MKPSEKVIETIKKLIDDDWVSWAGNKYSRETWEKIVQEDPQKKLEYTLSAVLIVLDGMAEKIKLAGMGFPEF